MHDQINGLFELVGAAFLWLNVLQIRRDREIKGVDWKAVAFFFVWGLWNLVYYPSLGQYWSLCGGAMIVVVNFIWLAHVAYYALIAQRDTRTVHPVELLESRPLVASDQIREFSA